jgi:hypothetical protein
MPSINDVYQSKWLVAADLKNKSVTLTIERATVGTVGQGAEAKPQIILDFMEHEKPLGLNKTNSKTIADCYGDDYDGWIGESIVIFPTQVDYEGSLRDAIRVNKKDTMAILQTKLKAVRAAAKTPPAPFNKAKLMTQAEVDAEIGPDPADDIPF